MAFDAPRNCTFTCRLDCHYLLQEPEEPGPDSLLVAALHGLGGNPEDMLRLMSRAVGPRHAIASVEGPHQFYVSEKTGQVGYGWGTRYTGASTRLHHEMVQHVLNHAGRECGIPAARRVLAGFSHPVVLNYRFAAACPGAVRGLMSFCGGVPEEWGGEPAAPVSAAILHIARSEDEYYPRRESAGYGQRLRRHAADVEFHMLDGPHRFPSKAAPAVARWLERLMRAGERVGR